MVTSRQFYAIKAALTATEKEIINYYELQWHLRTHVPSIEELKLHLDNWHKKNGRNSTVPYTSVSYYLNRKPVQKALKDRGIPYQNNMRDELTPTQVAAAVTVMNMVDDRPIADKLDQLGINPSQYYAWLQDPQFKSMVDNLADKNLANIRPAAIAEFTKKINQGDWNAIKYWMETTGELTKDETPQSEILIRMIIEVIQEHVKDPEVIMKIAMGIKAATQNRTIEVVNHAEIEAGPVIDIELEDAKKKLGIG